MNKNISTLALIVCFAGSLAFAGEKKRPSSSSDETATTNVQAASYDASKQDNDNPCSDEKKHHKDKKNREKNCNGCARDRCDSSGEQQISIGRRWP